MRKKILLLTISIIVIGLVIWGINYFTHSLVNSTQSIFPPKIKTYNSNKCGVIIPSPYGYTNDFVSIFTKEEVSQLDSIMGEH
jgi:hypothetical protein